MVVPFTRLPRIIFDRGIGNSFLNPSRLKNAKMHENHLYVFSAATSWLRHVLLPDLETITQERGRAPIISHIAPLPFYMGVPPGKIICIYTWKRRHSNETSPEIKVATEEAIAAVPLF